MEPQSLLLRIFFVLALLASQGYSQRRGKNKDQDNQIDSESLLLRKDNVQTASQSNGLDGAKVKFTPSKTNNANFINFCSGKKISNGLQVKGGSCNPIPMGDIPSADKMVSAIIISPQEGSSISANEEFKITVKIQNLQAGTFVNPMTNYYSSPQQLNSAGITIGHTHVTIQNLGNSLVPSRPPAADVFEFFKGINDAGDGKGLLTASSGPDGLPVGFYRVCTITSSSNHQAVLSPVFERGAQDDCSKFTVVQGRKGNSRRNSSVENCGPNGDFKCSSAPTALA